MNPTCLFVDVGGVLLTNGWDAAIRQRTAAHFQLELAEMDYRHHLTFDTYEEGKINLEDYLAESSSTRRVHSPWSSSSSSCSRNPNPSRR